MDSKGAIMRRSRQERTESGRDTGKRKGEAC